MGGCMGGRWLEATAQPKAVTAPPWLLQEATLLPVLAEMNCAMSFTGPLRAQTMKGI